MVVALGRQLPALVSLGGAGRARGLKQDPPAGALIAG